MQFNSAYGQLGELTFLVASLRLRTCYSLPRSLCKVALTGHPDKLEIA